MSLRAVVCTDDVETDPGPSPAGSEPKVLLLVTIRSFTGIHRVFSHQKPTVYNYSIITNGFYIFYFVKDCAVKPMRFHHPPTKCDEFLTTLFHPLVCLLFSYRFHCIVPFEASEPGKGNAEEDPFQTHRPSDPALHTRSSIVYSFPLVSLRCDLQTGSAPTDTIHHGFETTYLYFTPNFGERMGDFGWPSCPDSSHRHTDTLPASLRPSSGGQPGGLGPMGELGKLLAGSASKLKAMRTALPRARRSLWQRA